MIVFIPLPPEKDNNEDWAISCAEFFPRECPYCHCSSIVGHGRRRKQAHDEEHDWICIRRGICNLCGTTFTFLPIFSLPYCHYSLAARSQAVWRYFVEGCSLDVSAPLMKDPDRIPAASTLQRWFHSLDSSILSDCVLKLPSEAESMRPAGSETIAIRHRIPFPFLQKTLEVVRRRLARGEILHAGSLVLSWRNLVPFLHVLQFPLRC
jgi:hypothetical protein